MGEKKLMGNLEMPDLKMKVIESMKNVRGYSDISCAKHAIEQNPELVNDQEIMVIIAKAMQNNLGDTERQKIAGTERNDYITSEILEHFKLPEDYVQSSEAQTSIKKEIKDTLSRARIDLALSIIEKFHIPADILQTSDIQDMAKDAIVTNLAEKILGPQFVEEYHKKMFDEPMAELIKKFGLPENLASTSNPETISAGKKHVINGIENGWDIDHVMRVFEAFSLNKDDAEIKSAVEKGIESQIFLGFSHIADEDIWIFHFNERRALQILRDKFDIPFEDVMRSSVDKFIQNEALNEEDANIIKSLVSFSFGVSF